MYLDDQMDVSHAGQGRSRYIEMLYCTAWRWLIHGSVMRNYRTVIVVSNTAIIVAGMDGSVYSSTIP